MWFLILSGLILAALIAAAIVTDVKQRRKRRRLASGPGPNGRNSSFESGRADIDVRAASANNRLGYGSSSLPNSGN